MTKIVFFGSEDFSLATLQALIENDFPVALVITKPDSPRNRGQKMMPPKVKTYAEEHGIRVLQPHKLAEVTGDIATLGKPAGVLVSYGKIIPQSIIDLFEPGIINVHPSLLPKYRGPSPVEAAILGGDEKSGVSIMQLNAGMDTGPVYYQEEMELQRNETGPELLAAMSTLGALKLVKVLPDILNGSLQPESQDDSKATYSHLIKKTDGIIDWSKPATQIEREIRAYEGWPQSRTTLADIEIIITEASVAEIEAATPGKIILEKNRLLIGTGQFWLEIHKLKPLGKKEMPISAFLAGYRTQLSS